jgi:hypothetical protein
VKTNSLKDVKKRALASKELDDVRDTMNKLSITNDNKLVQQFIAGKFGNLNNLN